MICSVIERRLEEPTLPAGTPAGALTSGVYAVVTAYDSAGNKLTDADVAGNTANLVAYNVLGSSFSDPQNTTPVDPNNPTLPGTGAPGQGTLGLGFAVLLVFTALAFILGRPFRRSITE